MTSLRYELAHAARRTRALNEQLPENLRLDLAAEWSKLEAELDRARSQGARELALVEWRHDVEGRLSTRLLHAPIEPVDADASEPAAERPRRLFDPLVRCEAESCSTLIEPSTRRCAQHRNPRAKRAKNKRKHP